MRSAPADQVIGDLLFTIDELVKRFNAEVRISYETQSTRLPAEGWLFRRNSGYNTTFVGSSNLSRSALVDGLAT
ncbi:MAG: hypothetical protein ACRDSE_22455 [Pseudonocardiaceae bacterium]